MFHAFMYVPMFHLDVAKVDLVLHMLQRLYTYVASVCFNVSAVSNVCCKCFIWMVHMLHWLYTYVRSVYFNCFNYVAIVFYLDVAYVVEPIHMLQTYLVNVSPVSDVCCSKCFKLQVFHEQARQGDTGEGDPLGRSGPRMRTGSEASAVAGAEHEAICMGMAVGTEHEAASMGGNQCGARGEMEHEAPSMGRQQARSTKLHP
jgi:hypothetical protein